MNTHRKAIAALTAICAVLGLAACALEPSERALANMYACSTSEIVHEHLLWHDVVLQTAPEEIRNSQGDPVESSLFKWEKLFGQLNGNYTFDFGVITPGTTIKIPARCKDGQNPG